MLVNKFSEFRTDDEFLVVTSLYSADDLCVYTEALRDLDYLLGVLWRKVNLETMTHVEYLVHLCPVCAALLVDSLEKRRYREEVVLDHTDVVAYEMKDLGLSAARAVNHTMDLWSEGIKKLLHYRSICTCRRKDELTGIDR